MAAKTIIVTGASRGKHPQIPLQPMLTAHNVVVVARSLEPLQKLRDQYSKQVEVVAGDLADMSLPQKAVDIAIKSFGQLDGMVLNHGILGQTGKIATTDVANWQEAFNINFMSLVAFTTAAIPALRESKGNVVFTSSGAAVKKYRGWAIYAASKAAMNNFAQSLGCEEPDITSLAIQPGMVDTDMQVELRDVHGAFLDAEMHSKFTGAHKDGLLLKPEQPGHVMAKVVLDAPKELTGRFLAWNGEELKAFQE
ncbi:Short-chain dehydrogenase/reductase SDR [Penicillium capsulatum]|uniref:Short-chain dehydrogenase/reductase SDR n=1 Tax=Penicillium capsulatum TaxID=69766 RepID=A0A9W9HN78_9EURO|nr:Short-chain dehydrogenase/reductase SDR [Penicillium capsulatum]KAJ6112523.1 Short-chain dehydrogenase/reductase SDR [Penicillium capsulatum]